MKLAEQDDIHTKPTIEIKYNMSEILEAISRAQAEATAEWRAPEKEDSRTTLNRVYNAALLLAQLHLLDPFLGATVVAMFDDLEADAPQVG